MTTSLAKRHVPTDPAILYFGTPVVLLSTRNRDGTANLAPVSSVCWLDRKAMLGVSRASQSWTNMRREREVVLAVPSADQVQAVDRLALVTGRTPVPEYKSARGYRHAADKFSRAGLTPVPSDLVGAPRVDECPVAMECTVDHMQDDPHRLPIVEVTVQRVHAHPDILVAGNPNRVDPDMWRPLITSFQQFYGLQPRPLHPSALATIDEELYRD
ncbi:flavin reductase family protein [Mycolicibacterium sp. P1-18]|nr:flavin reductase family protein [Mycolicibacterium sp. P1-18]